MRPTKDAEMLRQKLIGVWDVELERTMSDGNKVNGTGIFLAKETALGHAVFAEYALSIPGSEDYMEGELWWFDPVKKEVHVHCVTSREDARTYTGRWTSENTLQMEWEGEQEGIEASSSFTFTWTSPNKILARVTGTHGGEKGPRSVITMTRKTEIEPVRSTV
ncbi:MAG: hypothetical protein LUQ17_05240 [Methanomicrobiales archaeon]|nr:hypothetical protein [Methanomicrobiales archaeon]